MLLLLLPLLLHHPRQTTTSQINKIKKWPSSATQKVAFKNRLPPLPATPLLLPRASSAPWVGGTVHHYLQYHRYHRHTQAAAVARSTSGTADASARHPFSCVLITVVP
jgi:hypothetical protein